MAQVFATARIFGAKDEPIARHKVLLQAFQLSRGAWGTVGDGQTDGQGRLKMKVGEEVIQSGGFAPALRLIEPGEPAPRVLGAPVMMQMKGRGARAVFLVDFGELERLDDAAYDREASETGLDERTVGAIAGMPRRPGLSHTNVLRTLERSSELREALSSNVLPPEGLTLTAASAEGTLTVSRTAASDKPTWGVPVLERQLGEARALLLRKDDVIAKKELDIRTKNLELQAERKRVDGLGAELSAAKTRVEVAEEEAAQLKAEIGQPPEITTVFSGLGTKLGAANEALQEGTVPFRLGAIKVDLRGRLTKDGTGIVLGQNAADGSGVSAELYADVPQGPAPASGVRTPDCTGLTPAAAARVLRSVGLRLRPAEQRLPPGQGTPGQALTQHPPAGGDAAHGTEVLVVFGTRPAEIG